MIFIQHCRHLLAALALSCLFTSYSFAESPEILVAQGVGKVLPGYQFNKRLAGPSEEDHILLFSNGPKNALVTWTEGSAKTINLPASPMRFTVYDSSGKALSTLLAQNFNINLVLAKDPAIYVPEQDNAILQVASLAETLPQTMTVRGPQIINIECEFVNPMNQPLILSGGETDSVAIKPGDRYTIKQPVKVGRSFEPIRVNVGASGIFQTVTVESENPILLDLKADLSGRLTVDVLNPTADPFSARMQMKLIGSERAPFEFPVEMGPKETIKQLEIPLGIDLPLPNAVQLVLVQPVGNPREDVVLAQTMPMQFVRVRGLTPGADSKPLGWRLEKSGELFAQERAGEPPEGAPWGNDNVMLAYKFDQPGASMKLSPLNDSYANISQKPAAVSFWINGDRSGNQISVRWRDATGKIFQPKPRVIDWKGWRYETFAVDSGMVPPLKWDSLAYVEASKPSSGAIMISGPVLTYRNQTSAEKAAQRKKAVEVEEGISYGDPMKIDPRQLKAVDAAGR